MLAAIPAPISAQWFVEVAPRSSRRLLPLDRSCTTPPDPERRCDERLVESAMSRHEEAQQLRRGRELPVEQLQAAMEAYREAARLYREYLACDPPDALSCGLHFNLADALYWSERHAEAATFYRRVRDWSGRRRFEEQAGARTVESLERLLRRALEDGALALPAIDLDAAPREPPALVAELILARQTYLVRVAPRPQRVTTTSLAMRREQALLLARYGHRALARPHLDLARRDLCRALAGHVSPDWEWEELRAVAAAIGAADLLSRLSDPAGRCDGEDVNPSPLGTPSGAAPRTPGTGSADRSGKPRSSARAPNNSERESFPPVRGTPSGAVPADWTPGMGSASGSAPRSSARALAKRAQSQHSSASG